MGKRKISLHLPRIKIRDFPIRLIIVIIVFVVAGFVIGYLGKTLRTLDYFRIKEIMVNEGESDEFSYFKGRNIFSIDLKKESIYISELYPSYKKIRLIRVLPSRIFVDFIKRRPLAYIKLYRYLCVDDDQVLFDVPPELQELDLPLILGLETKIFGPKSGKKYNIRELALGLDIIRELNNNKALKDYKLKTVDVASLANASFFLQGPLPPANYTQRQVTIGQVGTEVRVGQDDIKGRINILSTLLGQIKKDWGNIRYIDLRFKEPVIKFK